MRVLVVDDETNMARILRPCLEDKGSAIDTAPDGIDALHTATENDYDAVILDVMLPGHDGFEVCRKMRSRSRWAPVLMLTARDGVTDRVQGLDAGADDYLSKPFSFEELLARVRALVRRGAVERPPVLCVGNLTMDPATRRVERAGKAVSLTPKEYALLEYFMRNPGVVLSRTRILDHVWDYNYDGASNVVDVYVKYLRRKIDTDGEPSLKTVRGAGYLL